MKSVQFALKKWNLMAAILKEHFIRRKKNNLTKTARAGLRPTQTSRSGLAHNVHMQMKVWDNIKDIGVLESLID